MTPDDGSTLRLYKEWYYENYTTYKGLGVAFKDGVLLGSAPKGGLKDLLASFPGVAGIFVTFVQDEGLISQL